MRLNSAGSRSGGWARTSAKYACLICSAVAVRDSSSTAYGSTYGFAIVYLRRSSISEEYIIKVRAAKLVEQLAHLERGAQEGAIDLAAHRIGLLRQRRVALLARQL